MGQKLQNMDKNMEIFIRKMDKKYLNMGLKIPF